MNENFGPSLQAVLRHEGGFVNNPNDPGGATMKGITLATYSAFLGRQATVKELINIPSDHIYRIYKYNYWDKVRGDDLPMGVDYCTFDAAVNSGPARAAKWLQKAVGVPADGVVGDVTVAAAKARSAKLTISTMCEIRLGFLRSLSHWEHFKNGWTRRVKDVQGLATEMVGNEPPVTPTPPPPAEPVGLLALLVAFLRRLFSKE